MILPEVYQGGGWFPSFSRFMEAFDPKWYRTYGCAPYTPEEVRETAVEFAPDIPALPEEYLDFLAHMGGRGLDLHHRAWLYHGGQLYLPPLSKHPPFPFQAPFQRELFIFLDKTVEISSPHCYNTEIYQGRTSPYLVDTTAFSGAASLMRRS